MTEFNRSPGRVDEESTSIDEQLNTPNKSKADASKEHRVAGKVDEISEPLSEDVSTTNGIETDADPELSRSLWSYFFWIFAANIFIWLGYETYISITGVWEDSPSMAIFLAIISLMAVLALILAGYREYKAAIEIDVTDERSRKVLDAIESDNLFKLREALEPTIQNLRRMHPALISEFEEAAKSRQTTSDYLNSFENIVLLQLDKLAQQLIQRHAVITGSMVAILPHPALDAGAVLWRSTIMVKKLGNIYGMSPTGVSSLRLVKRSIENLVVAAGTGVAIDHVMMSLGDDLLNKTFSKVGEGAVTSIRLYRLGVYVKSICRPVSGV